VLVQVHLAQNRLDLAQAEVRKARSYAQDHLLVNLAESWVNLREVRNSPFRFGGSSPSSGSWPPHGPHPQAKLN